MMYSLEQSCPPPLTTVFGSIQTGITIAHLLLNSCRGDSFVGDDVNSRHSHLILTFGRLGAIGSRFHWSVHDTIGWRHCFEKLSATCDVGGVSSESPGGIPSPRGILTKGIGYFVKVYFHRQSLSE